MLVTLTQQSLELEDGTGKKKEQSLKIFETKKCSWSTEQRISFLYSYVDFLMFAACKIHAYQLIHYRNGSLEYLHLQVETPIYDGDMMIPVCKLKKAPGKVQICECPQESTCSPALQPVPCKLEIVNWIKRSILFLSYQSWRVDQLWCESCANHIVRVCHALNTVTWWIDNLSKPIGHVSMTKDFATN